MKLSQLIAPLNATLHGEDLSFKTCSTDSRAIDAGSLFVALKGLNFDGHDYVQEAVTKGAIAVVIEKESGIKPENLDVSVLVVDDGLIAYGQIASLYLSTLSIKKAALTGSCGKTSVKEILSSILAESGEVYATRGNFNNEVGVPKTLLEVSEADEFAVIEMGANHAGEIAYLSSLAQADVVALLNADRAHIEGFGSLEGVARAKGEIFSGAAQGGFAVLSLDEPFFEYWRSLVDEKGLKLLTCSMSDSNAVVFLKEKTLSAAGFDLKVSVAGEDVSFELALLGDHNIKNALVALTMALALNIPVSSMVEGLKKAKPAKGRLNVLSFTLAGQNHIVLDDSYNANPLSVKAAIDVLSAYDRKRVMILGDMAELGDDEITMHQEVGAYAKERAIDVFVACGELAQHSASAFYQDHSKVSSYSNKSALLSGIQSLVPEHESAVFLVKGSRSAGMEEVVQALVDLGEAA